MRNNDSNSNTSLLTLLPFLLLGVLLGSILLLGLLTVKSHGEELHTNKSLPPIGVPMFAERALICDTKEQLVAIDAAGDANAQRAKYRELHALRDKDNEPSCNIQMVYGPQIVAEEWLSTRDGMDYFALKVQGSDGQTGWVAAGYKTEGTDL
jgi:hypothetical protein